MREKLETLPLAELKAIAKEKGLKNVSTMKKKDLIDALVNVMEGENEKKEVNEVKEVFEPEEKEELIAIEIPKNIVAQHPQSKLTKEEIAQLDSGVVANGILEVMPDGYGFIRCENYMPGDNDVYVSPAQIRKLNLKTGDIIEGNLRTRTQNEKFAALLYVKSINRVHPLEAMKRKAFEDLIPIFPNKRIHMETEIGRAHV